MTTKHKVESTPRKIACIDIMPDKSYDNFENTSRYKKHS